MRKEEKAQILESISAQLAETPNFYITDISGLNAENTSKLRRECFEKNIKLVVVKNTLFHKALEALNSEEVAQVYPALEGPTAIMYCETANAPAKLVLKAAYVQECAFVGADKLGELCNIKSREELIADIVALLQAPARNVISALQNGGPQTIAGLVKTLSEKE